MSEDAADVVVLDHRIEPAVLRRLVERFEDMVKYVVDVERGKIAIGGEMHSDAEQDPELRSRVRELTFALVGEGEAL